MPGTTPDCWSPASVVRPDLCPQWCVIDAFSIFSDLAYPVVADAASLTSRDDLDAATILSANREALAPFGFATSPPPGVIFDQAFRRTLEYSRWREELFP